MSKKQKIILISALCLIVVSIIFTISYIFHFQYEWRYETMMKSSGTLDKTREMARKALYWNLGVIAQREGMYFNLTPNEDDITTQNLLVSDNPEYAEKDPDTTIFKDGVPMEGNQLYYSLGGRITTKPSKPMEIRFAMQALLYIRGRKLHDELGNIVGIAGKFYTNSLYGFYNGRSATIGWDEFEELYKECGAEQLSHEERVTLLTRAWILKTGYDRPHLKPE